MGSGGAKMWWWPASCQCATLSKERDSEASAEASHVHKPEQNNPCWGWHMPHESLKNSSRAAGCRLKCLRQLYTDWTRVLVRRAVIKTRKSLRMSHLTWRRKQPRCQSTRSLCGAQGPTPACGLESASHQGSWGPFSLWSLKILSHKEYGYNPGVVAGFPPLSIMAP